MMKIDWIELVVEHLTCLKPKKRRSELAEFFRRLSDDSPWSAHESDLYDLFEAQLTRLDSHRCLHCDWECSSAKKLARHMEDQHTTVKYRREDFLALGNPNMNSPEILRDVLILAGIPRIEAEKRAGLDENGGPT